MPRKTFPLRLSVETDSHLEYSHILGKYQRFIFSVLFSGKIVQNIGLFKKTTHAGFVEMH